VQTEHCFNILRPNMRVVPGPRMNLRLQSGVFMWGVRRRENRNLTSIER
jgi:hypothetical protein